VIPFLFPQSVKCEVTTKQAMPITFTVYGEPRPAGSKRAFPHPTTGRIIVKDESGKKGEAWRRDVQAAAQAAYDGPLLEGPLRVAFTFYRPRPKGHYGTGRNAEKLKPSAPRFPITRPDVLKLARAVEDALTGLLWRDDAQIVDERLIKRFAEDGRPLLFVEVEQL